MSIIKDKNNFLKKKYKDFLVKPKKNKIKYKNFKEVNREFNKEEWKGLYNKIINSNYNNIHEVDHEYNNLKESSYFFLKNNFYKKNNKYIIDKYIKFYSNTIKKYLDKNKKNNLVELGSGYGSKIINLYNFFQNRYEVNYFAGELSLNGRKITNYLSKKDQLKIKTFKFNFLDKKTYFSIPLDSIVFTSYSMHYMPKINKNFFLNLKKRKPKIIINFEPLYEVHNSKKLHGALCRNYILSNDYCINQYSLMQKKKLSKEIKIININKNFFGSNPLLPLSEIVWKFS